MKVGRIRLGLRGRVLLLLLFAAGFRGIVMIGYLFDQRDRDIAEARRTLAVHAVRAGDELVTRIDGAHQLLSGLAQVPALNVDDRPGCSAYLANVLRSFPQYTGILTIRPDGKLHCDSLQTGRELNLTDRAYFRKAVAGDGLALEPAFGRLTGTGVMQAAMASRDENGKLRFVILASIGLDRVAGDVLATRPYDDTSITIVDRAGTVLAGRTAAAGTPSAVDTRVVGKSIVDTGLGRFAQRAKAGDTADFAGPSNVDSVWAAGTLPARWDTGLTLVLGVPRELLIKDAMDRAHLIMWTIIGATTLIIALGLALAEWGIRRPLARIMAAAARFSRGDLSARIGTPYATGEIGDLMLALDRSAAAGEAQQLEIKRFNTQMEELVRQRTAELEAVNGELKAFSYSIAHDLRQPLIAMNGYAALIRKAQAPGAPPATAHYLDRISQGVRQVSDLADAMVTLAHLSRTELVLQGVDISALADKAVLACREREPARKVRAEVQAGVRAVGDAALLELMIFNLVDNAWKFSAGQAEAEIAFGALPDAADTVATAVAGGGEVVYFVKDNGVGFDMAYAGRLFSAFHRLHSAADYSGTGIGLANVRKIVTRHGGRIWAEAAPGKGAVFYFTLAP